MIGRLSGGWQTTMADLALILFLVTAAGVSAVDKKGGDEVSVPARGEPIAIYSDVPGGLPLADWLAEQAPDERQHLTIVAQYRPGQANQAAARALELASQAGEAGAAARIVIEAGESEGPVAMLAYDRPRSAVARTLQDIQLD
jgi:hypothetical protein